jgi:sugar transferase (PEP-CTERM/EpsH1 system associated)
MRVLFLTQRLPYAPNRGDRLRAYHMMAALVPHAAIDLISLVHDAEEASHIAEVTTAASVRTVPTSLPYAAWRSAQVLLTGQPLTHALLDGPGMARAVDAALAAARPDVVFAYCSGMARFALEPPLSAFPLVLDFVDVDSAKWTALGESTSGPKGWVYRREARVLGRFEALAARRARASLVTTDRERDALLALAPEVRVEVIQNGVDLEAFLAPGPPGTSPAVVFCGVMNYAPNETAALWLAREVWPLVRVERPDARLTIVGASPTAAVSALAAAPGVSVTGSVPDVRPYLWEAAVAVAPLMTARGVQNKVLEAVAAGLPCVVTNVVAAGLPPEVMPACTVAGSAPDFARAIVRLLAAAPGDRRALAARATVAELGWRQRLAPLPGLLSAAASSDGARFQVREPPQ